MKHLTRAVPPSVAAQVAGRGSSCAPASPLTPPADSSLLTAGTSAASRVPRGDAAVFSSSRRATDTHVLSMQAEQIVLYRRRGFLVPQIAQALGHDDLTVLDVLHLAQRLGVRTSGRPE